MNLLPLFLSPMEDHTHTLSRASHLTRPQLLRRRFHHLRRLSKFYRDLYWILLEDLKTHYRHYLWHFGFTPFRDLNNTNTSIFEGTGENNTHNNFSSDLDVVVVVNSHNIHNQSHRCAFVACNLKAMPLTTFCHLHILSDSRQKLYKPCNYVIKSAQAGPITCGKPILRSTVPSLCSVHYQKAQKHLTRTLKRTALNISLTSKMDPKFHVMVSEYVHQIQVRRRKVLGGNQSKIAVKKENDS